MPAHVQAILWAQWRSLMNFRRGAGFASWILPSLAVLIWYGFWAGLSVIAAFVFASHTWVEMIRPALPGALLVVCLYWQLAPLMAASLGASIDLKKLLVYPVPHRQLFGVEVLLRVSTCIEMLMLCAGAAIGLWRNSALPNRAAVIAFVPFVFSNLFLAAGLRNQLERLMSRRRFREVAVLTIVLAAALPQVLFLTGLPAPLRNLFLGGHLGWYPWSVTARLALGSVSAGAVAALVGWTVFAWLFGRWQFERSLQFDFEAAQSEGRKTSAGVSRMDAVYRLPALLFRDPMAAVVEKELRSLSRTPRFRLVFIMGFTFGLLIFLPVLLRGSAGRSAGLPTDHLAMVGAYALLLLGDVGFWNVFGFDRAATQLYYLQPVKISRVLVGKNVATAIFVFLEMTAIAGVWALVRLPVTPFKVLEAFAVTLVLSLFLLGTGNLCSIYYPRAVNPERSTGAGSAGRVRALLLLIYPVAGFPVLLAYGARYAFQSQLAWWSVLGVVAALGAGFYWVALDTAVAKAEERRDLLLEALSRGEGPLALT
jgi:ABC-2 type transport system permease protein